MISESTAAAFFPGQDPIGKRIKAASFNANQRDPRRRRGAPSSAWSATCATRASTKCRSTCTTRRRSRTVGTMTSLVVRMKPGEDGQALAVAAAIQTQARQRDPRALVSGIGMLEDVVNKEIAPWRFSAWVFALFAALAFALSMLGLFSLVSLDVANRRQEFAIRMAVGATPRHIVGGVFRSAGARAGIGIAVGLLVAAVATRSLQGLLFGVTLGCVTYASSRYWYRVRSPLRRRRVCWRSRPLYLPAATSRSAAAVRAWSALALRRRIEVRHPIQNVARMPALKVRPSSGAHASTVQRPSIACDGQHQRIELRLSHVGEVLGVQEDLARGRPCARPACRESNTPSIAIDTDSPRAAARR